MVIWIYGYLKSKVLKTVFVLAVLFGLLYPVILYFPYYLDYYNLISGGSKAAYENRTFTVGWWGEGGLAAVRYINQVAPKNAVIRVNFSPRHTLILFRPDLRQEQNFVPGNKDDFILVNTYNERYTDPLMLSDLANYKLVYEVAPLVKVFRRI